MVLDAIPFTVPRMSPRPAMSGRVTNDKKTPPGPTTALTLGVKELFTTGLFSDLTITCGGHSFKVHKSILYPQSSFFRSLLGGKFKEATEGQTIINLDDDHCGALQSLLHYFYNFTYDDSARHEDPAAPFAVHVYAIADKYDVAPLRSMAAQKLKNILNPAKQLDEFLATICAIEEYTNPKDMTLWDIVLPKIKAEMSWLADEEKFFGLVQQMPRLNRALLKGGEMKEEGLFVRDGTHTSNHEVEEGDDEDYDDREVDLEEPDQRSVLFHYGGGRRLGGD